MRTRIWAALGVAALIATACGRLNGGGSGAGAGIEHPTGADELVLRVELVGGFVPVEWTLTRLPSLSIYGDGRMIVEGPQIEIYPGPALPNLLVTRLSEGAVQAILEEARAAGLLDGDARYGYDCVADAPSTRFTVVAGGRTSVVEAYALGFDESGACPGADADARGRLFAFQAKLGDLGSWLPEGSIGREEPYEAPQMRVYVLPYRGEPELPQQAMGWPLAEPLASFGEPLADLADARCGVVAGRDLASLLSEAQRANQLTPWRSDGTDHRLVFRPLLPDEHGC